SRQYPRSRARRRRERWRAWWQKRRAAWSGLCRLDAGRGSVTQSRAHRGRSRFRSRKPSCRKRPAPFRRLQLPRREYTSRLSRLGGRRRAPSLPRTATDVWSRLAESFARARSPRMYPAANDRVSIQNDFCHWHFNGHLLNARNAMKNLWDPAEAAKCKSDLELRVYSSHLLGRDDALVLHGGGNTSVKLREKNVVGDDEEILYVKGSGWDLETIEVNGFAPVR